MSILSFSGGPALSQAQQNLGYGTATQVALSGLRTLLFQISGVVQIFHILLHTLHWPCCAVPSAASMQGVTALLVCLECLS